MGNYESVPGQVTVVVDLRAKKNRQGYYTDLYRVREFVVGGLVATKAEGFGEYKIHQFVPADKYPDGWMPGPGEYFYLLT